MKNLTLMMVPVGIALYSFVCTAAMLWWASQVGRSARSYERGLIAFVAFLVLPSFACIVPTAFIVEQRFGLNASWLFLVGTSVLCQVFPMFAAHGCCAMAFPAAWQRVVALRSKTYQASSASAPSAAPAQA